MLNQSRPFRTALLGVTLALAGFVTGCKDEGIRAYQVPKEQARAERSPHGTERPSAPKAHVHSESLPPNWQERPVSGVMRAAEFGIRGEDGQTAELAVFALPEVRGMELEFVNMWREQISLGATTLADIASLRTEVTIAGSPGQLFDMVGEPPAAADEARQRILVAMFSKEGSTWFFKLTGPDALVASEKDHLRGFLETVDLHTEAHGEANVAASAPPATPEPPASGDPATLPTGWKALTPGMMQIARFELPGGSQATVSTAGGDLLANVNRWRGQLQLEPIPAAGLAEITKPLTLASGSPATVVDMSGAEDRMVTVIVPRGAQSVFYKLMGPTANVARDRDAFLQFAQTAQY